MSSPIVRFTVDATGATAKYAGKTEAIRAALTERTTAINLALTAKIEGRLEGELLKSHTHKLAGSVRAIPTTSNATQIAGGVQAGGGPAFYAKFLEDGSAPHVIMPKDPKGVLAFRIGGQMMFRRKVMHPGTRAYLFMKGTLEQSREGIVASYQQAVDEVAG